MTTEPTARTGERGNWRVISQTAEYAMRAVLYIARQAEDVSVPAGEIADVLHVPNKYLARVLNTLRRAGILESVRGSRGGFRLKRSAAQLALLDVVAPFEPVGEAPPCLLRGQRCGDGSRCSAHDAWHGVAVGVRDFFQRTTVADLIRGDSTNAAV